MQHPPITTVEREALASLPTIDEHPFRVFTTTLVADGVIAGIDEAAQAWERLLARSERT